VTAQVFLQALPRLHLGASGPEVRAYLLATARTALADHWASRYGVEIAQFSDNLAPSPVEVRDDSGVRRALAILDQLPRGIATCSSSASCGATRCGRPLPPLG